MGMDWLPALIKQIRLLQVDRFYVLVLFVLCGLGLYVTFFR